LSLGSHTNDVASDFGLQSLQIFYPEMEAQKTRLLKSIGLNYNYNKNGLEYGFGTGYSERAPSVSEGYGFYLFNSSDRFDYIGNPNLRNEKSIETNVFFGYKKSKYNVKISSSFFRIADYIIGQPNEFFVPMTIDASGVKLYTALDYATIFNVNITTEWKISKQFQWSGKIKYSRGQDSNKNNLPFISPVSYQTELKYRYQKLNVAIECIGNGSQTQFGSFYEEKPTAAFTILNFSAGYKFNWDGSILHIKMGVENIINTYYTTYSDWNKIPRIGRNTYLNLEIKI
jgi:iron complex outermembrane receptor protein